MAYLRHARAWPGGIYGLNFEATYEFGVKYVCSRFAAMGYRVIKLSTQSRMYIAFLMPEAQINARVNTNLQLYRFGHFGEFRASGLQGIPDGIS